MEVSIEVAGKPSQRVPLEKYVRASRKLDLTGVDWDGIAAHPLPEGARRCLSFMADVEGYTVMYLRDVLNTSAVDDPEIARFMTLWAYEEMFHEEALARFLAAAGHQAPREGRLRELRAQQTLRDQAKMAAAGLLSKVTNHLVAAYLTWAAINELSTLTSYQLLARRAGHPVLTDLLGRIIKDERRHFSFYYHRASIRLQQPGARWLTANIIRHFWRPVGEGVKRPEEIAATIGYCMAGEEGLTAAREMDAAIARLPGLEWFSRWEETWHQMPRAA